MAFLKKNGRKHCASFKKLVIGKLPNNQFFCEIKRKNHEKHSANLDISYKKSEKLDKV